MKVFVTGTRGFPNIQGGIEKHCEELYPRIALGGVDVTVFARSPYFVRDRRLAAWNGVKFKYVWCPRIKSLEAIVHTTLCVLLARIDSADILHIHAVGPSLLAPLARVLGIKVVMTHHGPDYKRKKWNAFAKFWLRMGEIVGVRFSNQVIAVSSAIRESLVKEFPESKIEFIPNGVSPSQKVPAGEFLSKLGIRRREYIFTACRFVPEKGLDDLIEAYGQLDRKNFNLVIAGGEDHESEYGRSIQALATRHGVILTGIVHGKELAELYSNAGLFVLPSYYEGFPISLLEALSYGVPVLVSDIPAHREINLSAHRYFTAGNVQDLKEHIESLYTRKVDRKEAEQYRNLVQEIYDWDHIASKTLKVYRQISSR